MPKLGQTVEESTIVKWRKKAGDKVAKGEVIFDIETDKAVLEVESFFEGTLLKIIVPEGQSVPVTSTVAFIGEPGEDVPDVPVPQAAPAAPKKAAPAESQRKEKPAPSSQPVRQTAAPEPVQQVVQDLPPRHNASPRARKLIKESAVSADHISGTGPGGRIIERDVRQYLDDNNYSELKITPSAKVLAVKENIDILSLACVAEGKRVRVEDVEVAVREKPVPMPRIRQVIAERMKQSVLAAPHFYVTVPVDVTDLLVLRKELKKVQRSNSVSEYILKACALALVDFPVVNSVTDGKTVKWNSRVNIGLAVDIKEALVVPVIRDVDRLTMRELHEQAASLASKARDGKLSPDEMTGGTFTVSNMGMLGVENFTAIINPGESAILAVSSAIPTPYVVGKEIQVRTIMKITLSSDHRIIDGATAAKFVNRIKNRLEDTELWRNMT